MAVRSIIKLVQNYNLTFQTHSLSEYYSFQTHCNSHRVINMKIRELNIMKNT